MMLEMLRESARFLFEIDPLVRLTARRSRMTLAKTPETSIRLKRLGANRIEVFGESAISQGELDHFFQKHTQESKPIKFISVGRFLPWKGFSLGIQAFAMALQGPGHKQLKDAEYWLVGDGPEFHRLQGLTNKLGIAPNVKFWGRLSREDTMRQLVECQVLVHPSLHDSGGWACLEGMAAGKPVICLDLGGPATQVTEKSGFKVIPGSPAQVIHDISAIMAQLAKDPILLKQKEESARSHIASEYLWDQKRDSLGTLYREILEGRNTG